MYIYIYIYIYIWSYFDFNVYIYIYKCICMYVCMSEYCMNYCRTNVLVSNHLVTYVIYICICMYMMPSVAESRTIPGRYTGDTITILFLGLSAEFGRTPLVLCTVLCIVCNSLHCLFYVRQQLLLSCTTNFFYLHHIPRINTINYQRG